jgi:hypothetical protein
MAGNISGLHVFANDTGPEALSLLDGNFTPLATAFNNLNYFTNYYVDGGGVNTLSVTLTTAQLAATTLLTGLTVLVQCGNTNTSSSVTLNVGATGAKTVLLPGGQPPPIGCLQAGYYYVFTYDGTTWSVQNATLIYYNSSGFIVGLGPVSQTFNDMTADNSFWDATFTGGFASSLNGDLYWERNGKIACVNAQVQLVQTSNAATDITISGLPAAVTPAFNRFVPCMVHNGGTPGYLGMATVSTAGTILLQIIQFQGGNVVGAVANGWITSGAKGVDVGWQLTYGL